MILTGFAGAAAALFVSTLTLLTPPHPPNIKPKIYDYFLTLDSEISLIWGKEWNTLHVLFLVNRYLPFFEIVLNYIREFLRLTPLNTSLQQPDRG